MACAEPLQAWRPANGGPLIFNAPGKGNSRAYIQTTVPCGYCILCQEEKARQQAVRIVHEAQMHDESAFLTLTYADEHLPPYNSLRYDDTTKFWKRVRKALWKKERIKLRYYMVGEYGDKHLRPHYHACVFGYAFTKNRIVVREGAQPLWTTVELERAWGLGNVRVGELSFASAAYTASYVLKKLRSKQQYVRVDEQTGELMRLEQPRAFMSRNLAKAWWEANRHYVSAHDMVVINGSPQKPPKAYDRWLKERSEIAKQMLTEERIRRAPKQTTEQLRARARNAHARARSKNKTF